MKKCAAIVSLSLCCLCFCTSVFSADNADFTENSPVTFHQKKIAPLMPGRLREIPQRVLCLNLQLGNNAAGWVSFEIIEPVIAHMPRRIIPHSFVPNPAQRLLKNYLLHLFPSHYFW